MQRILSLTRRAIEDYHMIAEGDKIAVGLSGGKDSICLLAVLNAYKKFAPYNFEIIAININLGFAETDKNEVQALKDYCANENIPLIFHDTDIARIIFEDRKEKSPCSLCSKMRRGALNTIAIQNGCNKIALGHHADDILETMLMCLMNEGRFSTFSPVSYMDRTGITLIRPFIYIEEKNLTALARNYNYPIVHNPCPKDKNSNRSETKQLIKMLNTKKAGTKQIMLGAIYNPSRNNLWDTALPEGHKKDNDDNRKI
ncbi:MAG: tRNA lysidine(34) synthetase TilS [Clostridia bacterium]|nr:tRNA lysidine(34) synthetase TilS [Clostridia bacterium]